MPVTTDIPARRRGTAWWISIHARERYVARFRPDLAPVQALQELCRLSLDAVEVGTSPCGKHRAFVHPDLPAVHFIVSHDVRGTGPNPSLVTVLDAEPWAGRRLKPDAVGRARRKDADRD